MTASNRTTPNYYTCRREIFLKMKKIGLAKQWILPFHSSTERGQQERLTGLEQIKKVTNSLWHPQQRAHSSVTAGVEQPPVSDVFKHIFTQWIRTLFHKKKC
jgi:hypothetical protein